jgi:hypothetical protein
MTEKSDFLWTGLPMAELERRADELLRGRRGPSYRTRKRKRVNAEGKVTTYLTEEDLDRRGSGPSFGLHLDR